LCSKHIRVGPTVSDSDSHTGGLSFGDLAKQAGGTAFSATPVAKEAPKVAPIFGAKQGADDEV
jgi:hypothetical protein